MKKIGLVSLGCAKNLVDSEMILAMFREGEYALTNDPAEADLIIVNTCGFIEDAKREAISTILEMRQYKAKLLAVGCLVQRNLEELKEAMPEVDSFVRIDDYPTLHKEIDRLLGSEDIAPIDSMERVLSTPDYAAYLKISEGCNNMCSFCAIPYIRGRYLSRSLEDIVKEAKILLKKGVKELSLVSQDPMHYGCDFPNGKPDMLDLMKALEPLGFYSIRLLYLYPDELKDEHIEFIASSQCIVPYFDVPIQCASDPLLKRMNRHCTVEEMRAVFRKIRDKIPNAVLRTTLISGFPGESEADHKNTLSFIEEIGFDHLGDFVYSREEGTASYSFKGQVPAKVKKARHLEIMDAQRRISYRKNKTHIGEIMEGIVIGADKDLYSLRSYWNAPDDIDGRILFRSQKPLKRGEIVRVKITDATIHDLVGELAE